MKKEYFKPIIIEEKIVLEDIVASSNGTEFGYECDIDDFFGVKE